MEHKNYVSQVFEMTWNVSQVWNSVLDVFWKRSLLVISEIRVMFMVRVSLGCRRLAQNLVLAPASMTAGMATMYCLQPQIHTHIYIRHSSYKKKHKRLFFIRGRWNKLSANLRFCYPLAHKYPAQANKQHTQPCLNPRETHDWDELQGHNITVSAAKPHPVSLAYMTTFSNACLALRVVGVLESKLMCTYRYTHTYIYISDSRIYMCICI